MAVCVPHLVREVRRQLWELVRSFYCGDPGNHTYAIRLQASGKRLYPLSCLTSHDPPL